MVMRDRGGNEIDPLHWSELFQDMTYRLVAEDQVGDVVVRTVWEGVDDLGGAMFCTGVAVTGTEAFSTIADSKDEGGARRCHGQVVALARQDSADDGLIQRLRAAVTANSAVQS